MEKENGSKRNPSLEDALSVQTDISSVAVFYGERRILRLNDLKQTFVVCLVMRLAYKEGRKNHYASRRTILRNTF